MSNSIGLFESNTGAGGDFSTDERWGDIIELTARLKGSKPYDAALWLAERYSLGAEATAKASAERQKRREFTVVSPVLDGAPPRRNAHPRFGRPVAVWEYKDAEGRTLHYVARFENADGKSILPLCLCRNESERLFWTWKHLPPPRPLYNLDGLARATADTPVLLVEGEKTADAAGSLFPDHVCMTWSGGAQATGQADFTPLQGRAVTIWPDNDEPGFKAALAVAARLQAIGATSLILPPPDLLPKKWDVADAPPADFDPQVFLQSAGLSISEFTRFANSSFPALYAPGKANASSTTISIRTQNTCMEFNDDSVRPWPELSPVALPGVIGEFVTLATRNSEADPAAVLATLLVRFGVEVYGFAPGQGPYMRIGETVHPPRLYAVIAGASSKARKGTSAKPVLRLFSVNPYTGQGAIPPAPHTGGPLSSGEGLAFRLREREEPDAEPGNAARKPTRPPDKRLFIIDEELAAAMIIMRRDGNILSMALRSFWDSGDYEPLTKNSPVVVRDAHVGIVTHITIQEVKRILDATQLANGFANRFLWVCARREKRVACPQPMPERDFIPLRDEIWRRVRLAQSMGELAFTPAGRQYWENAYANLSKDMPGISGDITARSEAQCIRLALIYALLDAADAIDLRHLRSALAFWLYARDSALYIFGNGEEDALARRVLGILGTGPKSTTELNNEFGGHIQSRRLQTCLQELIGRGLVCKREEKTTGRPRITYCRAEKAEQGGKL